MGEDDCTVRGNWDVFCGSIRVEGGNIKFGISGGFFFIFFFELFGILGVLEELVRVDECFF